MSESPPAVPGARRLRRDAGRIAAGAAAVGAVMAAPALAAHSAPVPSHAGAAAAIRVRITAANHHPRVNRKWRYTVTVTSASGRPLSGTETTHYLFNGRVVGTEKPVNVRFRNGVYRDALIFPGRAVGHPLRVWAVVHTRQGSGSAAWWITVVR